jgi:hypothetical protein
MTLALMFMSTSWIGFYYSATLTIQWLVLNRFLDFGSSIFTRYFDPRLMFDVVSTFISWVLVLTEAVPL